MIRVKVCGITRLEDALAIAGLGVDYLGFIFCRSSPRYVEPEKAASIIRALHDYPVRKVGVFVNESAETVNSVIRLTGLDLVQLHGDYPLGSFCAFQAPVIRVVSVGGASDLSGLEGTDDAVRFFLFDTKVAGRHGGTGESFDWGLLADRPAGRDFFLAGGLNAGNIEAACAVRPYAVDLNSGVESAPGVKDLSKARRVLEIMGRGK